MPLFRRCALDAEDIDPAEWGPPVMLVGLYAIIIPMKTIVLSTINHSIQPLINQLNAILGAPSCENSLVLMETNLPTPMTARVYANLLEGRT